MTIYVFIKRDLFECPGHMGYTGILDKAGTWSEEYVRKDGAAIREKYDPKEMDHYAASAGEDDPLPSSPAPTFDWLPTVARMLWAATNRGGDTEYNLDVLNNQRKACNALDATPTDAERDKAGSIYRVCKEVVLGTMKKADALKIIAGHAGIEMGAI